MILLDNIRPGQLDILRLMGKTNCNTNKKMSDNVHHYVNKDISKT